MGKLKWNDKELRKLVGEAAEPHVKAKTAEIKTAADSMSAGFRTGLYHRDHKSPAVGNTKPKYKSSVKKFNGLPVGIVYTGNYSAMKDNTINNTLLKARG